MTVLIPIETSSREMLYKTYLAAFLADNGFSCYIGSKKNIFYLMNKFKNYIYLDKGYHKGVSDELYKIIKKRKSFIVNLDEEGAIDFPDGSTLKNRYSKELLNASDKILLWGNYQYNLLKDLKISLDKVVVTGHPRFQLLKPKYHHFYTDEINKIKNKYGNFILINSNFGFGNNIKGDDFVIKNYGSRVKRIKEIVAFDRVKKQTYINLVKELAKDKSKKIIYRPHPEENLSIYKETFKNLDNVLVIFQGSVVPWIIASEVMIHPDCTTGIEAFMVGKKSISLLPENYSKEIVTDLPVSISYQFENIDDVLKCIDTKEYEKNENEKKDFKIIDKYFSYNSLTTDLILDEFNKIKETNVVKNKLSIKDKLKIKLKDLKLKNDNSDKSKLAKKKLEGFNFKNLKKIKAKLSRSNKSLQIVRIKPISNYLFFIYNS